MKVAFVGIKRPYQELAPDYRRFFTQYHLELPYYFAKHAKMKVTVVTTDYGLPGMMAESEWWMNDQVVEGHLDYMQEQWFKSSSVTPDIVVHWRKWHPELYKPGTINVINCQDHSFSPEWKDTVVRAYTEKKLYGILCFPTWHRWNLYKELDGNIDASRLIAGLTLGVDTDIYTPSPDKDPYQLLWASDPGRGLDQMMYVFMRLSVLDRRFRLNVCYPDYCAKPVVPSHPGIIDHGNVPNGPRLWDLFNGCGVLAYTSNFKEPSSRAHRQAMAAGSLVLYPPNMGSPSELIEDGKTGFVRPVDEWHLLIYRAVTEGWWKDIGQDARRHAISENWEVQAKRFRAYFEGI